MSLRALAAETDVSAMALSKYERGLMRPSANVMRALAKALRVTPSYFTEEAPVELSAVEYRASSRMTVVSKRLINAEIRRQLELRREVETLVPELATPFEVSGAGAQIASFDQVERVAATLRAQWGLGAQPITSVTNVLEARGVAVLHLSIRDGWFDGLSCWVGKRPVIVISKAWPGDRQRFTLAHELGHLVMHSRLSRLDEERACHRFAGAFIAPKTVVKSLLLGKVVSPLELWFLKHEWGLSMNAWIYRLRDAGKIGEATARRLWREFRARGWNTNEPGPPLAGETATFWPRRVCSLVANGRITSEVAANVLDIPMQAVAGLLAMDGKRSGA